ncbi:MAG: DegT/DnrJ/EryC1/StrS family aminotransferase [Phycisphaerae bacterium]|nr:DegT/DnrJ/EryC1/StrS family aminotransferase [Phycisphaerae bacterium]
MKVPFLDLKAQYETIQHLMNAAIQQVIDQTAFAGGPFVERFEKDFAAFCNCKYAIGCSSGTSALRLALFSLGIGEGDEVITAPNTFIATAEAISACGAKPIFVDIDEKTYNMDPDLLEDAITPKTKAVIPVHLYGQVCEMEKILRVADSHGLFVIEDACQAHGATYKEWPAGSMGDAGCFSFYPGKNLGAYGEAGAVTTNKPELAEKMRMYRDHGQQSKYYHSMVGWNDRMDGIQGAILSVKLQCLAQWNQARRNHAQAYSQRLSEFPDIITPSNPVNGNHVYHIYAIRVRFRDTLMKHLAERGIGCGIHYPVPIHLQKAYRHLGLAEGFFPVAEACAREQVSLPMFPELRPSQIDAVCQAIETALPVIN